MKLQEIQVKQQFGNEGKEGSKYACSDAAVTKGNYMKIQTYSRTVGRGDQNQNDRYAR